MKNTFLFNKNSHFNLANLFTFINIISGLSALFFINNGNYIIAIILAWIGGFFDIFDGKISRKFKLSNEFGIQLDSYADFITFVLVPVSLIQSSILENEYNNLILNLSFIISITYIVSGIRRLITFNIKSKVGKVDKYFTGIPTPLGAIILLLIYISYIFNILNVYLTLLLIIITSYLLNSKIKIKHP